MENNDLETGLRYEEILAKKWAKKYGFFPYKLPTFDDIDYLMTANSVIHHFLEVRTRNCAIGDYQKTMIRLSKHLEAVKLSGTYKVIVLIQWTDFTGWMNLATAPDEIKIGGRDDRGKNETSLYGYWNVNKFTKVELK